jgi:hypothetical protein
LAVNHKVLEHPEISHQDPYHTGWLLIAEPSMPKRNLRGLYFGRESVQWMEREAQELAGLMGAPYENLAATGGVPIRDVHGQHPEIGWEVLVHVFLKTRKK